MSRQGLIDRWGGYVFEHARGGSTLPLFIVRVRTIRPDTGSHRYFSKVLPNESSRPRRNVTKWRHFAHARMTSLFSVQCYQMTSGSKGHFIPVSATSLLLLRIYDTWSMQATLGGMDVEAYEIDFRGKSRRHPIGGLCGGVGRRNSVLSVGHSWFSYIGTMASKQQDPRNWASSRALTELH